MKLKYLRAFFAIFLILLVAGCAQRSPFPASPTPPSIAEELDELKKGIKDIDSIPTGVNATGAAAQQIVVSASTTPSTPFSNASSIEEFSSLVNSMNTGIGSLNSIPNNVTSS